MTRSTDRTEGMSRQRTICTSAARSRSTVREALESPEVPLGLGEAVTTALGVSAAVFSVLGLEDLGKRFEFGLEGVVGLLLGHDDPS